jgi:hypothetical protein
MTEDPAPMVPQWPPPPHIDFRGRNSLRRILPDYWSEDGKTFRVRSVITSYSVGPIENKIGAPLAQFIKENCRSARRLRTMSISAYESFASTSQIPSWANVGTMTFIALTAGVSALDALACVLWGVLFQDTPQTEKDIPSMNDLKRKLFKTNHPCHDPVQNLLSSNWCKLLHEARHRVVHRGFWPRVGDVENFVLCQTLEPFAFGGTDSPPKLKIHSLDLATIMGGILCDLEAWDLALDPLLKAHACFTPFSREDSLFCQVSGQAQTDWALGTEFTRYDPTEEFWEEWGKHQESSSRESPMPETGS